MLRQKYYEVYNTSTILFAPRILSCHCSGLLFSQDWLAEKVSRRSNAIALIENTRLVPLRLVLFGKSEKQVYRHKD